MAIADVVVLARMSDSSISMVRTVAAFDRADHDCGQIPSRQDRA
jgi:hypothetical protein